MDALTRALRDAAMRHPPAALSAHDTPESGERAPVELPELPGRGPDHVAFWPTGAADGAQVVFIGVDCLENAMSGARPGRDPRIFGVELGQLLALGIGHGPPTTRRTVVRD